MTTDPSEPEDVTRPEAAAATPDDERPIDDDDEDEALPDHLDLPLETPSADALDQRRAEHFDDDME